MGARPCSRRQPVIEGGAHDSVAEAHPGPASRISARRSVSTASRPVKWSSPPPRPRGRGCCPDRAPPRPRRGRGRLGSAARAGGWSRGARTRSRDPRDALAPRRRRSPALALARSAFTRNGTPPELAASGPQEDVGWRRRSPRASRAPRIPSALSGEQPLDPRQRHRLQPVRQVGVRPGFAAGARADDHERPGPPGAGPGTRGARASADRPTGGRRRSSAPRAARPVGGPDGHMPWRIAPPIVPSPLPPAPDVVSSGAAAPAAARSAARSSGSGRAQARLEQLARHAEGRNPTPARRRAPAGAVPPIPAPCGPPRRAGSLARAGSALEDNERALRRHAPSSASDDERQFRFALDEIGRPRDGGRLREGPSHAGLF